MVQLLAGIISLRRVLEANPGRSHGSADTLRLRHSANCGSFSMFTSPMTLILGFQGQILKMSYLRSGMADWHGTKGMWVYRMLDPCCDFQLEWVGLWGFLWWAPLAKRKDHHRVSSGWSSTWFHSNTGLSSTQYEQIPIIFGVWPFWLTPFFFRLISPCGLGDPSV